MPGVGPEITLGPGDDLGDEFGPGNTFRPADVGEAGEEPGEPGKLRVDGELGPGDELGPGGEDEEPEAIDADELGLGDELGRGNEGPEPVDGLRQGDELRPERGDELGPGHGDELGPGAGDELEPGNGNEGPEPVDSPPVDGPR